METSCFFFFLIEGVLGSLTEWRHPGLSLGEVAQVSEGRSPGLFLRETTHISSEQRKLILSLGQDTQISD